MKSFGTPKNRRGKFGRINMNVLVTGSHGYIGSVLVPMLAKNGHKVTGLDTDYYRKCTFTGEVKENPTIYKDIRDVKMEDLKNIDAIIHLAGLSNDPLGDFRPTLTEEINSQASINLAHMAKKVGVKRFLFASSCSNYGSAGNDFLDEEAPFNPVTPYGISKVKVEEALEKMADDQFSPTYLRASTAYGVSPRLRFDLVTNNLTAWAFTTKKIFLKSDGSPWRPIVHVNDIALAYLSVLNAEKKLVHNEAFNVGMTSENYQIREIAILVRDIVPNCEVAFASDAGPDKRNYRVNCDKICRTLHEYKPQWTARRGIEQLYAEYKKVGLVLEEFEGPRFMRIAHIKQLLEKGELDENLRWTK